MDALLSLLKDQQPHTGEALCAQLGVTRAAVWKRIEKLRADGYQVQALGRKGYRLAPLPDCLLPGYVAAGLHTQRIGCSEILHYPDVPSTNDAIKALERNDVPEGLVCIAEQQTRGKGRMGRAWQSQPGRDLLFSVLLRPNLHADQAHLCTLAAAVAVAGAVRDVCAVDARIKWPNDVVVGGKKIAGILCEMASDFDCLHYVVIGVGVNVNSPDVPPEIAASATTLRRETRRAVDRQALLCAVLDRLESAVRGVESDGLNAIRDEYVAHSATLGSRVRVQCGLLGKTEEFQGLATALNDAGALLVTTDDGQQRAVVSADVSVRGVMGYV